MTVLRDESLNTGSVRRLALCQSRVKLSVLGQQVAGGCPSLYAQHINPVDLHT